LIKVVVDASVALAWWLPDETSLYADDVLVALRGNTVIVPSLWSLELANAILVGERRKRLQPKDIHPYVTLLEAISIVEDSQPLSHQLQRVLALARDHALSAYDASYLELALRHRASLATLDVSLQNAANSMAVSLFPH
jgi:predicted nucleic acid-binding protein